MIRSTLPAWRVKPVLFPTIALSWLSVACSDPAPATDRTATTPAGPGFIVETVYTGLHLPTSLVFAPDGKLLILERGFSREGVAYEPSVAILDLSSGQLETLKGRIPATSHFDEFTGNQGGAVGLALDPQFRVNQRLYVCYHAGGPKDRLENRLSSFQVSAGQLTHETVLVDHMPGDPWVNGCRIQFDAGGFLYVSTGSKEPHAPALDVANLGGKILRITTTGSIPPDNPFPKSPVWSYGHRNPQGLAFDPDTGTLWATEHGEETADELNRIERGGNYGWPNCRGAVTIGGRFSIEPYWTEGFPVGNSQAICKFSEPHASRYRPAFRTYYPDSTVGISDLVVYRGTAFPGWRGNLLIAILKTEKLIRVELRDGAFSAEEVLIDGKYGRLRDVTFGPDGFVYVLTNEPGADATWRGHSRVLRVRPPSFAR